MGLGFKCKKCLVIKSKQDFYFRKDSNKYRTVCKDCVKHQVKQNAVKTIEYIRVRRKKYYENNKDYFIKSATEWRKANPEKFKKCAQKSYIKHKPKRQEIAKSYYQKNKKSYRFRDSQRRAKEIQSCPKWLSKQQLNELKIIYLNCPEGFEVDHIIPLNNPIVSGLHVPWNLQYLTIEENRKKGNRLEYR